MKQRIILVFAFVLLSAMLAGCDLMLPLKSFLLQSRISVDYDSAEQAIEALTAALNSSDVEATRSLFSQNAQDAAGSLDEQIHDAFHFVAGRIVSYTRHAGPVESQKVDYGVREKYFEASYRVETELQEYCIAIRSYTVDDADRSNIGISSIYISRLEDTDPEFAFWGDGLWTQGITILEK